MSDQCEVLIPMSAAVADQVFMQETIMRSAILQFGEFNIERLKIDVPTITLLHGQIHMRVKFSLDDALHLCPLCEGRGLIEHKEGS